MNFLDNGKKGIPLVLLHGNSSSKQTFSGVINRLPTRALSIDLLGHGNSERRDHYSLLEMAKAIYLELEKRKISQFHLAGHSLGGHVAINLINLIKPLSLITWGTPPLTIPLDVTKAFNFDNPAFGYLSQEDIGTLEIHTLFDQIHTLQTGKLLTEYAQNVKQTDPHFRPSIFESLGNGEYLDEVKILKKSKVPTLFVFGSDESFIRKEYVLSSIQLLENAEFKEIENASHYTHIDCPEEFNTILVDLILKTEHLNKSTITSHSTECSTL